MTRISIDHVTLDQLQEFLERGSMSNASAELVAFVEMLDKVRGMIKRFDIYGNKEGVIKHLVAFEKLSKFKANQIYAEAIQYFYIDSHISKRAYANLYAEKMDNAANMALMLAKDVSDVKKYVEIIKEAAAMRQLHVEDAEELPEGFFDKPIKLLTTDPNVFEFGKANRIGIEDFIDKFPELTEKEKLRIKQEAGLHLLKIFPDEQEDPRRS